MTEKSNEPSSKFSIREYFENLFNDQRLQAEAQYERNRKSMEEYDQVASDAKNPVKANMYRMASWIVSTQDASTSYYVTILSLLNIIATAIEFQPAELTQTQQERMTELEQKAREVKGDIDKHLAKRLSELLTSEGHEAMYGTGKRA